MRKIIGKINVKRIVKALRRRLRYGEKLDSKDADVITAWWISTKNYIERNLNGKYVDKLDSVYFEPIAYIISAHSSDDYIAKTNQTALENGLKTTIHQLLTIIKELNNTEHLPKFLHNIPEKILRIIEWLAAIIISALITVLAERIVNHIINNMP